MPVTITSTTTTTTTVNDWWFTFKWPIFHVHCMGEELQIAFIDPEKAFDGVLWGDGPLRKVDVEEWLVKDEVQFRKMEKENQPMFQCRMKTRLEKWLLKQNRTYMCACVCTFYRPFVTWHKESNWLTLYIYTNTASGICLLVYFWWLLVRDVTANIAAY